MSENTKTSRREMRAVDRFPRVNARGEEVLDPRPLFVHMVIDEKTGEVLQEGLPPRPTLEETLRRATMRSMDPRVQQLMGNNDLYDVDDDDDFDSPEDDGSLPEVTPYMDGFMAATGLTPKQALKRALKEGLVPPETYYDAESEAFLVPEPAGSSKTDKKTPAHPEAGASSTPPAEPAE